MKKPVINLHIETLIGKLVVVNIPFEDNNNLDQSLKHSAESVKSAVESVLLKALSEIDTSEETYQKENLCNAPQK